MAGYYIVSIAWDRIRDRGATKAPHQDWSNVLEVSPQAGVDEIHAAYGRMMALYHPEAVSNLGKEIQELAERKSQQITAAYHEAIKARSANR